MTDSAHRVSVGDVVSGLERSELVEVTSIESFSDTRVLVRGHGVESQRIVERPLTQNELDDLEIVRTSQRSFDGGPEAFLLGVEAERIRVAHQFDPLFAVNSSVVDPLPHQIEAVYRYLLPLPRIRFLLADDTGAGKTIMTGLLIKELMFRGAVEKVLIITPGGLTKQWQEDELEGKFGLHARLVNNATFRADPSQFASPDTGIFIISIDFISRNEGCLAAAQQTQWDMVVVDEAHKLSAYEYGTKLEESGRYRAVKLIAPRADHLLFLTATPHRGRRDTFRRLLMLLDEDVFQRDEQVSDLVRTGTASAHQASIGSDEATIVQARNRFFLRRLKEEMVDWDGLPLFTERHTRTVGYDLTPEEKLLYDEVTSYVRSRRKEAKAKNNRNVELTLMVMQRRLASSIFAITRTLERRLDRLAEVLEILRDPTLTEAAKARALRPSIEPDDPDNIAEYEDLHEEDREKVDERIFRQVLSADPADVERERDEVRRLFEMATQLAGHPEAKFFELLGVLDSSEVIRDEQEKLLIFTEHKDTMESLTKRLEERGYAVSNIHGGMDVDSRKRAQRDFRIRTKIMVATDAAGEGINLQFCRHLINWDIPWNPNRLEQRMGRIHRYGQTGDVHVYNLVAQNTREGAVLQRVLTKLDVMREQLGSDRVYDVIDELLEDISLVDLMERAIDEEHAGGAVIRADESLARVSDRDATELISLQKRGSLASRLDLQSAQRVAR